MCFDTLPTELLQIIFSFTTWSDQTAIGLVCRRWAAAVEPLLLSQTRLKVSFRKPPVMSESILFGDNFKDYHSFSAPIHPIDKKLLMNSNRKYTNLRIEWGDERRIQNMEVIQELLSLRSERFPVQKLYLRVAPGKVLTDLFHQHRKWLENLTELDFVQCGTSYEQPVLSSTVDLSLPKLKHLTWLECTGYHCFDLRYRYRREVTYPILCFDINQMNATLNVPELISLKVRVNRGSSTNPFDLALQDANGPFLFLPTLNLKCSAKLQHVEILMLPELDQSVINKSAAFLKNLKSLTLIKCNSQVIEKLCEKCLNLEDLTIAEKSGEYPFRISSTLSHSLKKLSLKSIPLLFSNDEAVFSELRYFRLIKTNQRTGINLNAPRLTTIIASQEHYEKMTIVHAEQIRTMAVEIDSDGRNGPILLTPNVTELFLYPRATVFNEKKLVEDYIKNYPNLRRLTVFGQGSSYGRKFMLRVTNLPNLEYLRINGFRLYLDNLREMTHLKTLILSDADIIGDGEVLLTALEYIQVKHVTTWRRGQRFPIIGTGQQPEMDNSFLHRFSSPNFELKEWYEIIPK